MPNTICENCKNEVEFDRGFDSVDYECPYCGKTFRSDGYCILSFFAFFNVFIFGGLLIFQLLDELDKPVDKNEISEIEGEKEKNNPYLYEDGFFVSYQKKYDTVWAMCKMMGPLKIGTLRSEYSTRVVYEEAFKEHYSPQKPTNDVWIVQLKNSIRNMKPDSSEQQQHTAIVDLANTFIAADNLLNSEVSASTFLYELNSIEKNYVEALRKVELNISPD